MYLSCHDIYHFVALVLCLNECFFFMNEVELADDEGVKVQSSTHLIVRLQLLEQLTSR
jgi:hypothetical protein